MASLLLAGFGPGGALQITIWPAPCHPASFSRTAEKPRMGAEHDIWNQSVGGTGLLAPHVGHTVKYGSSDASVVVNVPSRAALFQALRQRLSAGEGFALATLNLDHLTKLPRDPDFAAAYAAQDLVVADGRPVVWLSHLARQPVELMPGSDLLLPICELAAELSVPVAFFGSDSEALEGAAEAIRARVPGIEICHIAAPPMGFEPQNPAAEAELRAIAESGAGLCILALGAPKQEVFAARGRAIVPGVGFACFGAGLDFLAGRQRRAPLWMRSLALEWLWRALQSPRRMVPRYARCFAILPGLMLDAWRARVSDTR